MRYIIFLMVSALSMASNIAVASSFDDFTTSDVVGMFAAQGTVGPLANTKTMTQAHAICVNKTPSGDKKVSSFDADYYSSYKVCMALYVPFKVTGQGEAGTCATTTVSWGECSASLATAPDGTSFSLRNEFNTVEYEGFSNFICSSSQWQYISGGCSRAAKECDNGLVVSWGVTSPLWADESSTTVFVDRFGTNRHTPKPRCYSKMPSVPSGKLLISKPTVPEVAIPQEYNLISGSSPNRCFNGEWLPEPASGADVCEYIPKSCQAKSYQHPGGCGFSLPSGAHDQVFVSSTPTPQNSVGGVQAHCWDGNWEVKTTSCALSCDSSVPENSWVSGIAGVDRSCKHVAKNYGQRIAPGTSLLINNEVSGMDGNVSYTCSSNGAVVNNSEQCNPKGCVNLPAGTWAQGGTVCEHPQLVGSYLHGQKISQQVGDIFSVSQGSVSYVCKYGFFEIEGGTSLCRASPPADNVCYGIGSTADPSACLSGGVIYPGGLCCLVTANGNECYAVTPPVAPPVTPPPPVSVVTPLPPALWSGRFDGTAIVHQQGDYDGVTLIAEFRQDGSYAIIEKAQATSSYSPYDEVIKTGRWRPIDRPTSDFAFKYTKLSEMVSGSAVNMLTSFTTMPSTYNYYKVGASLYRQGRGGGFELDDMSMMWSYLVEIKDLKTGQIVSGVLDFEISIMF
jgi:hypothetical protein